MWALKLWLDYEEFITSREQVVLFITMRLFKQLSSNINISTPERKLLGVQIDCLLSSKYHDLVAYIDSTWAGSLFHPPQSPLETQDPRRTLVPQHPYEKECLH